MGWFSKSEEKREYDQSRRDLDDVGRRQRETGNRDETDEWRRANKRVIDAEKNIPWHRR